jgi:2-oxoglutarate dehydrogenase E1 component
MIRTIRKPLIVMTPKSLLRAPAARSATAAFEDGHFRETIDDERVPDPATVKRILLCSGKIAHSLLERRDDRKAPVAIVRLEQLYPFPDDQLDAIFSRYPNAEEVRWVQEEPRNMGAWGFVYSKLARKLWDVVRFTVSSRPESASPSTGSPTIHTQEQEDLIKDAFEGL